MTESTAPEPKKISEKTSDEIFNSQVKLLNYLFQSVIRFNVLAKHDNFGIREKIRAIQRDTEIVIKNVEAEVLRIKKLKENDTKDPAPKAEAPEEKP